MGIKIAAALFALGAFAPTNSLLQACFGLALALVLLVLDAELKKREFYSNGWTAQLERAERLEAELKGKLPAKSDAAVLDEVIEKTRGLILSKELNSDAMRDFELADVLRKLEAIRSGSNRTSREAS